MDDGDVADLAAIDAAFRSATRNRVLPWAGRHFTPRLSTASTMRSASATLIAIGLPRTMCLPARADRTARSAISDDRRGDLHDVDVGSLSSGVVGVVGIDAERRGERVQLLSIVPGHRPQFGLRVFRHRASETVCRVPVSEAENPYTPRARHVLSVSSRLSSCVVGSLTTSIEDSRFGRPLFAKHRAATENTGARRGGPTGRLKRQGPHRKRKRVVCQPCVVGAIFGQLRRLRRRVRTQTCYLVRSSASSVAKSWSLTSACSRHDGA